MEAIAIDADQFFSRLNGIKTHWLAHKNDMWEGADALCVPMGSVKDQDVVYSKSSSVHLYLLGYEFPDSLLVLTPTKLFFMATQKKIALLETIKDDSKFPIETLVKTKDQAANRENFKTIINEIKSTGGSKLGTLVKDNFEGSFVPSWNDTVQSDLLDAVEISRGLGYVLSIKDAAEQEICKRAAVLTKKVFKLGFVEEMEEIIDKAKKVSHEAIAEKVWSIFYHKVVITNLHV
jgi:nucleosome binding factor SPN SPT16 subunit